MESAACAHDANLVCFACEELGPDSTGRMHVPPLFPRLAPGSIDALVIGYVLAAALPRERLAELCSLFAPLPVVALDAALPGIPSVIYDERAVACELTRHLIEVHGRRRLGFFCTRPSWSGEERHAGFRAGAEAHGLYAPELVALPSLRPDYEEVAARLRGGQTDADAIVACDDSAASRVIERLTALGRHVPDDVAVVGFDNAWHGRGIVPPLTTADIPLERVGARAVEVAFGLLAGREVAPVSVVPVKPVFRRSCGCLGELPPQAATADRDDAGSGQDPLDARRTAAVTATATVLPDDNAADAACLVDAFCGALRDACPDRFVTTLRELLTGAIARGHDVRPFGPALRAMRHALLPAVHGTDRHTPAETLWHRAGDLTVRMIHAQDTRQRYDLLMHAGEFDRIVQFLRGLRRFSGLTLVLSRRLRNVGIPVCCIAFCESPTDPATPARLAWAYRDGRERKVQPNTPFPGDAELLPAGFADSESRESLIVAPLRAGGEQFGWVVYRSEVPELDEQRGFPGHLSVALGAIRELQTLRRTSVDLKRAARALTDTHAELERFAYAASHDLQEPLRNITGFLQLLAKRSAGVLDEDGREFVEFARSGGERLQRLVNDLLAYASAGADGKAFVRTDCNRVLDEVLLALGPAREESEAKISCGKLPVVTGHPVLLGQLFQNLLTNAMKFRRAARPRIAISAERQADAWLFAVQDNGIGMPQEQAEKAFDIFQRLHTDSEYRGTGIGLAVCRKIVRRHGGQIWAESEPDRGSTFYFTIPFGPASSETGA